MITTQIYQQISGGEDLHTEFKSNAKSLDGLAKTVCAFLNAEGGTIFCGVSDDKKIIGVTMSDAEIESVQAFLFKQISPKALFSVNLDSNDNLSILSIDVPEGKDHPYVYDGSIYIRQGTVTRKADALTMRDMVQQKAVTADRWERRPSMGFEMEDIDEVEVQSTVKEALDLGRYQFTDVSDDITVLRDLAVCNARGVTQGGDVLFGKNPAMRHPQVRVRLTRYEADKAGSFGEDRSLQGPLIHMLEEAFEFVTAAVKQLSFRPGDLRRSESFQYPREALREGLVNAFAHRDYASFSGGITVGVYPDRVEIWNSGRFPQEVRRDEMPKNHPSVPTNPDIAHVMYLRGLMERVGRGGQLIVSACRENGLPEPKWLESASGVTLIFYAALDGDNTLTLTSRQQALLADLRAEETISPAEYLTGYGEGITDRQARRDLGELVDRGLLAKRGAGPATVYVRTALGVKVKK